MGSLSRVAVVVVVVDLRGCLYAVLCYAGCAVLCSNPHPTLHPRYPQKASVEKCFQADFRWDYVFNLAAETKYSQAEDIYQEKVYLLSLHCAQQAAKSQVGVFVEMSTAQVYDADKVCSSFTDPLHRGAELTHTLHPHVRELIELGTPLSSPPPLNPPPPPPQKSSTETSKLKPWTLLAKYKLKAEEELARIPGLRLVIVRPATIYGVGDMSGVTPRLIIAAVYRELKEEMRFLWNKDLRINTVHVTDVARALVALAEAAVADNDQKKIPHGAIFNLSDQGDTDQEMVNVILRKIFDIQTGYQGTIISNLARVRCGAGDSRG